MVYVKEFQFLNIILKFTYIKGQPLITSFLRFRRAKKYRSTDLIKNFPTVLILVFNAQYYEIFSSNLVSLLVSILTDPVNLASTLILLFRENRNLVARPRLGKNAILKNLFATMAFCA